MMNISNVEALQVQLSMQAQEMERVVNSFQTVAADFGSTNVWSGADADAFRAALNDTLTEFKVVPPQIEDLAQSVQSSIETAKLPGGND